MSNLLNQVDRTLLSSATQDGGTSATAIQEEKNLVVIKIGCDPELSLNEYRALKHFDGQGSIQVLNHDVEHSALLLESAIPGTPLKISSWRENSPLWPYASVVKAIASGTKNLADFPHVRTWLDSIGTIKDPRISPAWIDKAISLRDFLLASAKDEYLCHGDLHFDNVLEHHGRFVAIDPKGLVGEMAFEASAFDLLTPEEIEHPRLDSKIISDRIHELSRFLNLDPMRLIEWIFLRILLSIQWSIEDQGDPGRMIKMGEKIYPLLMTNSPEKIKEMYFDFSIHKPAVQTERLFGYLPQLACFELYGSMFQDETFAAAFGIKLSDEKIKATLAKDMALWDEKGWGPYVWFEKASGEFVGRGGLNRNIPDGQPEIELAYALRPPFWNKGYASEMGKFTLQEAFETLKLHGVVCFTAENNTRSLNVIKKLGFQFEKEFTYMGIPHRLFRQLSPKPTNRL